MRKFGKLGTQIRYIVFEDGRPKTSNLHTFHSNSLKLSINRTVFISKCGQTLHAMPTDFELLFPVVEFIS
jgi:hypothetical protein